MEKLEYPIFVVTAIVCSLSCSNMLVSLLPTKFIKIKKITRFARLSIYVHPQEGAAPLSATKLVLAKDLIPKLQSTLSHNLNITASLTGAQLAGCTYSHVLADVDQLFAEPRPVVIGGDYITTESGTGLVHTAPGHGMEDF